MAHIVKNKGPFNVEGLTVEAALVGLFANGWQVMDASPIRLIHGFAPGTVMMLEMHNPEIHPNIQVRNVGPMTTEYSYSRSDRTVVRTLTEINITTFVAHFEVWQDGSVIYRTPEIADAFKKAFPLGVV